MDPKTYAEKAGITAERVRQLARAGRINAELIEGRWDIEYDGEIRTAPTRRPLSVQSRSDLLRFFVTMKLDHVKGVRKQRVAQRCRDLMAAPSKSKLLLEWWGYDEPEGTFAERNFIRAAQLGDEDWLARMLKYPDAWVLDDPIVLAARLSDRLLLTGLTPDDLVHLSKLPKATVRGIIRSGEGYGSEVKLHLLRCAGLKFSVINLS